MIKLSVNKTKWAGLLPTCRSRTFTVKPVYNSPVHSGHLVYYGHFARVTVLHRFDFNFVRIWFEYLIWGGNVIGTFEKMTTLRMSTVWHQDVGSKGAWCRALSSHQCDPGSNPGVNTTSGLSLLLILSFAPTGFSLGTPVFPSPQKPTFPNFQFDQEL